MPRAELIAKSDQTARGSTGRRRFVFTEFEIFALTKNVFAREIQVDRALVDRLRHRDIDQFTKTKMRHWSQRRVFFLPK